MEEFAKEILEIIRKHEIEKSSDLYRRVHDIVDANENRGSGAVHNDSQQ